MFFEFLLLAKFRRLAGFLDVGLIVVEGVVVVFNFLEEFSLDNRVRYVSVFHRLYTRPRLTPHIRCLVFTALHRRPGTLAPLISDCRTQCSRMFLATCGWYLVAALGDNAGSGHFVLLSRRCETVLL